MNTDDGASSSFQPTFSPDDCREEQQLRAKLASLEEQKKDAERLLELAVRAKKKRKLAEVQESRRVLYKTIKENIRKRRHLASEYTSLCHRYTELQETQHTLQAELQTDAGSDESDKKTDVSPLERAYTTRTECTICTAQTLGKDMVYLDGCTHMLCVECTKRTDIETCMECRAPVTCLYTIGRLGDRFKLERRDLMRRPVNQRIRSNNTTVDPDYHPPPQPPPIQVSLPTTSIAIPLRPVRRIHQRHLLESETEPDNTTGLPDDYASSWYDSDSTSTEEENDE